MFKASFSQYSKIKLVVIDLIGPISVTTWNSNFYILVIIKVSYYYLVRWLLKNKDKIGVVV